MAEAVLSSSVLKRETLSPTSTPITHPEKRLGIA